MRAVSIIVLFLLAALVPQAGAGHMDPGNDVRVYDLAFFPGNATTYERSLDVTVTIHNMGDSADDGFSLHLTACPATETVQPPSMAPTSCHEIAHTYVGGLPVNGALIQDIEWSTVGYFGEWNVCASIDNSDDHPENNIQCERVYLVTPALWPFGVYLGAGFRLP